MSPTPAIDPAHRQLDHQVRLDWGPSGALALAGPGGVDVAVVVDVLSFTTTLGIAVERGIEVVPCAWNDERAAELAATHDAVLAVGRLEGRERPGLPSLSPAAMTQVSGATRVVLPSPNGSTTCRVLASTGAVVVGASLRNAAAVAAWLQPLLHEGRSIAVVPAGERWPDDTLRPAAEDLWGAGAVLGHLHDADLSPEARVAVAAHDAVVGDLPAALTTCASGRELVERGFADDVEVAAVADCSAVVPVLADGRFRPAQAAGRG